MKSPYITKKKGVGWALRPLAVLAVGALLSASPLPAFASAVITGDEVSMNPVLLVASNASDSGHIHSDHEAVLELYRQEAENVTATIKAEIDRQRASTETTLGQINASATRIAQQSPQETGVKNSLALWRLEEESRSIKAQLPRQARALRDQWDRAIKSAVAEAAAALEKAEAQHAEPDNQKAKHRKEARKLLHKQRKETLALLDDIWKDNASQIRTRIAQAIESLDKAIVAEQAKERGPILGYRYVHHKGHSHREPIYQNEKHGSR